MKCNERNVAQQLLGPKESRRRQVEGRQPCGERGGEEREQRSWSFDYLDRGGSVILANSSSKLNMHLGVKDFRKQSSVQRPF